MNMGGIFLAFGFITWVHSWAGMECISLSVVIGVCWGGFVGVCTFGGRVLESCSWLEFRWALLLRL